MSTDQLPELVPAAVHVTDQPGLARDHDADAGCYCRPQRLFSIERDSAAVYLHRGASTRITRLTEQRR
jgi:hypothetical protein